MHTLRVILHRKPIARHAATASLAVPHPAASAILRTESVAETPEASPGQTGVPPRWCRVGRYLVPASPVRPASWTSCEATDQCNPPVLPAVFPVHPVVDNIVETAIVRLLTTLKLSR